MRLVTLLLAWVLALGSPAIAHADRSSPVVNTTVNGGSITVSAGTTSASGGSSLSSGSSGGSGSTSTNTSSSTSSTGSTGTTSNLPPGTTLDSHGKIVDTGECTGLAFGGPSPDCTGPAPAPPAPNQPAPPPPPDPRVIARQAIARLTLPTPTTAVGPDPARNEWNATAVGFPLWLWTTGPDTHTTTITEQGITVHITARRTATTFTTGDGATIRCTTTTPYPDTITPGTPSPTCGHRYTTTSPPGRPFHITATTHWTITWHTLGQTGTLPMTRTSPAHPITVIELVSLRTR